MLSMFERSNPLYHCYIASSGRVGPGLCRRCLRADTIPTGLPYGAHWRVLVPLGVEALLCLCTPSTGCRHPSPTTPGQGVTSGGGMEVRRAMVGRGMVLFG